jgi:hypothetical protein
LGTLINLRNAFGGFCENSIRIHRAALNVSIDVIVAPLSGLRVCDWNAWIAKLMRSFLQSSLFDNPAA